jgi:hypothetical protein
MLFVVCRCVQGRQGKRSGSSASRRGSSSSSRPTAVPFGAFSLAPGELPDGAGTCPVKQTLEQVCVWTGLRVVANLAVEQQQHTLTCGCFPYARHVSLMLMLRGSFLSNMAGAACASDHANPSWHPRVACPLRCRLSAASQPYLAAHCFLGVGHEDCPPGPAAGTGSF